MSAHFAERAEAMPTPDYQAKVLAELAKIAAELARLTAETKRLADAAHGPFGGSK